MPLPLYVQWQLRFRVAGPVPAPQAAVQAAAQGEWRAKTKAQKAEWKTAYEDLRRRVTDINELRGNARLLRIQFNQDRNNGNLNIRNQAGYDDYIARCNVIQTEYGRVWQAADDIRKAWEGLRDIEQRQPNPVPRSVHQATLEANGAANVAQQARGWQEQARSDKGQPPVALDALGRARIPPQWVSKRSKTRWQHVVTMEYHAEILGMDDNDNRRWVPQHNLSGGNGIGWAWVQIDGANAIRDVSDVDRSVACSRDN